MRLFIQYINKVGDTIFSCIAAIGINNELGSNGKLLWHIKEDLKYFKKTTLGKAIIMGRKTFESLPYILPNRNHIVLTNNKDYIINDPMVKVVYNTTELHNYISLIKNTEIFVIGGSQIYNMLLPNCNRLYITRIDKAYNADVFFPQIKQKEFNLTNTSKTFYDEIENVNFKFEIYDRK